MESSCDAVVAIHQDDRRVKGARPYIDIGVTVLRVTGPSTWELVGATGCSVERQMEVDVHLEPGEEYLIVPCTTGAKFRQQDKYVPTLLQQWRSDYHHFAKYLYSSLS